MGGFNEVYRLDWQDSGKWYSGVFPGIVLKARSANSLYRFRSGPAKRVTLIKNGSANGWNLHHHLSKSVTNIQ